MTTPPLLVRESVLISLLLRYVEPDLLHVRWGKLFMLGRPRVGREADIRPRAALA